MDFEKLEVWKKSRHLSADIYRQMKDLKDYGFKDQITRSGLSVPSNIAEGIERVSAKEKLQFLNVARASCAELRTQILIGSDIEYIPVATSKVWLSNAREISAMLTGLMKAIKFKI
jgi:four helix bundle protein